MTNKDEPNTASPADTTAINGSSPGGALKDAASAGESANATTNGEGEAVSSTDATTPEEVKTGSSTDVAAVREKVKADSFTDISNKAIEKDEAIEKHLRQTANESPDKTSEAINEDKKTAGSQSDVTPQSIKTEDSLKVKEIQEATEEENKKLQPKQLKDLAVAELKKNSSPSDNSAETSEKIQSKTNISPENSDKEETSRKLISDTTEGNSGTSKNAIEEKEISNPLKKLDMEKIDEDLVDTSIDKSATTETPQKPQESTSVEEANAAAKDSLEKEDYGNQLQQSSAADQKPQPSDVEQKCNLLSQEQSADESIPEQVSEITSHDEESVASKDDSKPQNRLNEKKIAPVDGNDSSITEIDESLDTLTPVTDDSDFSKESANETDHSLSPPKTQMAKSSAATPLEKSAKAESKGGFKEEIVDQLSDISSSIITATR